MTIDLWRARSETGASLEELAKYADLPAHRLREWERERNVPRKYSAQVNWAVWAVRRDKALERSGLPECEGLKKLTDQVDNADPGPVIKHVESCELCGRRSRFVDDHVGVMPAMGGGLLMRGMALVDRLGGWQQSATAGALFILIMGGIGVPILLLLAIIDRDPLVAAMAVALLLLLIISGAVGGIAFHVTGSLRRRGAVGHYVSSTLTVYAYLAAVFGMLAVAAAFVGWDAIDPDMSEMVTTPSGLIVMGVVGTGFGVFFGKVLRE